MTTDYLNFDGDSLDNYLGHEMIEINEESAKSKLVINKNHHQPMGLVHGGIYSTMAETLCSYGANFRTEGIFVGVNNNTDFLSSRVLRSPKFLFSDLFSIISLITLLSIFPLLVLGNDETK